MINVRIAVESVDYEESFRRLLPAALEKCRAAEPQNLMLRFLQKIDDDSAEVLLGIVDFVPEESCDELLCSAVHMFGGEVAEKFNQLLQEYSWGKYIKINTFSLVQEPGGGLALTGRGIEADYSGLLGEMRGQMEGGAAAGGTKGAIGKILGTMVKKTADNMAKVPPQQLEGMGISVLESEFVKSRLLPLVEKSLDKKGIVVKLRDIMFCQCQGDCLEYDEFEDDLHCGREGTGEASEAQRTGKKRWISAELEETLLDAMAAWFADAVHSR